MSNKAGNAIVPTDAQHDAYYATRCTKCGSITGVDECDDGEMRCVECKASAKEIDLEDGWLCFAESAEFSPRVQKRIEQIDSLMFSKGWKYTDAVLSYDTTSRGVRVCDANSLLFTRGKMTATWTRQDKQPLLTVAVADDWKVTANIETPMSIIEAMLSHPIP